jgi:uncharacterized membrane protein YbhN (UPF0104 family)
VKRTAWAWTRHGAGAAILAVLVWRLGTGPFLNGIRMVSGWPLLAAAGITVGTTTCSAWRWSVVAHGLGVRLPLRTAIPAYYRSQFLNSVLPGGVVGDVHRGVRQGQHDGSVGRGLRAVAWERATGQVVQVALASVVFVVFVSPVRAAMPLIVVSVAGGALYATVVCTAAPHRELSQWACVLRADLRQGVFTRRAWPAVLLASGLVVAGHVGTFLVAARTAGSTASAAALLPLAMLVLLAMSVPLSIGGWGPREGVAAWAFGAAGLGSAQGVAAATAYGLLTFVATLPGAVVLVLGGVRQDLAVGRPDAHRSGEQPGPLALAMARRGGTDG